MKGGQIDPNKKTTFKNPRLIIVKIIGNNKRKNAPIYLNTEIFVQFDFIQLQRRLLFPGHYCLPMR